MKHEPLKWKTEYDRDGYVVVEDCLDETMLKRLRGGIEHITSDPEKLPAHLLRWVDFEKNYLKVRPEYNDRTTEEIGNAIRNVMELPLFNPLFAELIAYEPVLDVLEALFGTAEFAFHNYKCIIKAPRVSSRFCWHRDLPYLQHSTPHLITAMLCLDDMTEANGATVVMPGTHAIPHEAVKDSDTDIPEKDLPAGEKVMVRCPAGSMVLFHVNIIHGGGANRSDAPRRNVIGIWSGPDCYPVTPARYAYQGLMPRSTDPARRRQMRMTFPRLFGEGRTVS
jgi:ectoine hydroxylase-related dioxygenase (phytanoyl-CoA dioxygenase family)